MDVCNIYSIICILQSVYRCTTNISIQQYDYNIFLDFKRLWVWLHSIASIASNILFFCYNFDQLVKFHFHDWLNVFLHKQSPWISWVLKSFHTCKSTRNQFHAISHHAPTRDSHLSWCFVEVAPWLLQEPCLPKAPQVTRNAKIGVIFSVDPMMWWYKCRMIM